MKNEKHFPIKSLGHYNPKNNDAFFYYSFYFHFPGKYIFSLKKVSFSFPKKKKMKRYLNDYHESIEKGHSISNNRDSNPKIKIPRKLENNKKEPILEDFFKKNGMMSNLLFYLIGFMNFQDFFNFSSMNKKLFLLFRKERRILSEKFLELSVRFSTIRGPYFVWNGKKEITDDHDENRLPLIKWVAINRKQEKKSMIPLYFYLRIIPMIDFYEYKILTLVLCNFSRDLPEYGEMFLEYLLKNEKCSFEQFFYAAKYLSLSSKLIEMENKTFLGAFLVSKIDKNHKIKILRFLLENDLCNEDLFKDFIFSLSLNIPDHCLFLDEIFKLNGFSDRKKDSSLWYDVDGIHLFPKLLRDNEETYFTTTLFFLEKGMNPNISFSKKEIVRYFDLFREMKDKSKIIEIFKLFLENGALVSLQNLSGETVLHIAARFRAKIFYKFLYFLKEKGFPLDLKDNNGLTVFSRFILCSGKKAYHIWDYFFGKCENFHSLDRMGRNVLHHYACSNSNIVLKREYLIEGIDINGKDVNGFTPLMIAAFNLDPLKKIQQFLEMKADPNLLNSRNENVLHILIRESRSNLITIIELLIKNGINLNQKDVLKRNVLRLGFKKNTITCEILQLLLENGCHLSPKYPQDNDCFQYLLKKESNQEELLKKIEICIINKAIPLENYDYLFDFICFALKMKMKYSIFHFFMKNGIDFGIGLFRKKENFLNLLDNHPETKKLSEMIKRGRPSNGKILFRLSEKDFFEIVCDIDETILNIKKKIERERAIPFPFLNLIDNGKILSNENTLWETGIEFGETILISHN